MDIDLNDPPPKRFHELGAIEQIHEMAKALAAAEHDETPNTAEAICALWDGLHPVTRSTFENLAHVLLRRLYALEKTDV